MDQLNNRRNLYYAAAAGVAVLLSLWFFWPSAVKVEMAEVRRLPLLDTVDAEARTRVKRKYTVTSPVSGKLERIELQEGYKVFQSSLIAEVDPNPPIPRAPTTPDNRPNPYAAKVFAPATGTILRVFEKSERFIAAGTPLLEIGDPANIEIIADVLSTDAVKIHPGSVVLIENVQSAEPVRARVRTVEPQATTKVSALGVEEKRVDVVADILGTPPAFGDNFRVDVRIVVWQGDNVLSVPNGALFTLGGEWNVFVVERGRAYRRSVKTLHRSRSETQIIDGLTEGESVILHPPNGLSDGSRVSEE
jgi:multidrug efflux pump subunit AcrA (membrane-fusion protein)